MRIFSNKLMLIALGIIGIALVYIIYQRFVLVKTESPTSLMNNHAPNTQNQNSEELHPMDITALRDRTYPGSEIVIEETLPSAANYKKYIASYISNGYKIYGLLTIPNTPQPSGGYPVIIILHGYIPPAQYSTTDSYRSSQDGLAGHGFVTFKPDLRGHGRSEGVATGAHFSESYVVDTLNLLSAFKEYEVVDSNKIDVWGHSNGAEMTLRLMVITKEIKAAVMWAGVVGSFEDMLETYNLRIPFMRNMPTLVDQYGLPSQNPTFWNTIDPYNYLNDFSGAVQIHHGTADDSVPVELSINLYNSLKEKNKATEYFEYQGADHNLNGVSGTAMSRSVTFFKKYLE
jgi:uncharacterized protein